MPVTRTFERPFLSRGPSLVCQRARLSARSLKRSESSRSLSAGIFTSRTFGWKKSRNLTFESSTVFPSFWPQPPPAVSSVSLTGTGASWARTPVAARVTRSTEPGRSTEAGSPTLFRMEFLY